MKGGVILNKEQLSAIRHDKGPMLVIAGAGTGKTTVIVERIKYLVESGLAKPSQILALTFTEKAAREMESRVDVSMPLGFTQMWISTFHSFGDRVLRQEALNIGLYPRFKLLNTTTAVALIRDNLFEFKLKYFSPLGNPQKFIVALLAHFGRLSDEYITPDDYIAWTKDIVSSKKHKSQAEKEEIIKWKELAQAYKIYEYLKEKNDYLDFGDLITKTLKLFKTRIAILEKYRQQFKYILVDEFQDTNFAQNELALLLCQPSRNITVVGDDDQAIYRFRGASVSNIIAFKKHFLKAKIVTLTKNYRSGQKILDGAYKLIQFNNPNRLEVRERVDKRLIGSAQFVGETFFLHSDRVENEAEEVARTIIKIKDSEELEYKDFAILVRANNHAEPFTRALARKGVPFQFLGPGRLFNQDEVKDLIAYLRVLYNLLDSVSLFRILSLDHFTISSRDIALIGSFARKKNISLFEACEKLEGIGVSLKTKRVIGKIVGTIKSHLALVKKESAGQILYYFLEGSGLLGNLINPDNPDAQSRAANISKFFDKLKSFEVDHENASVEKIVDWIALSLELGESPLANDTDWQEVNAVNILTLHSAKGLEFPVVFLVNLVSQRFPSVHRSEGIPIPDALIKEELPEGDFHLQEERRLFYVGMTRAKQRLYITAADYYGDGVREKKLSPFIFEALGDQTASDTLVIGEQLSFLDYQKETHVKQNSVMQRVVIDFLSYSQIETFAICPLHYKLRHIFKIPTLQTSSQSFGNSFHRTLKSFYENVQNGKQPTAKLLEGLLFENWIDEGYMNKVHEAKSYKKAREFLYYFFKNIFDPKILPIGMEQPFVVKIRNDIQEVHVGGKIDRVDKTKSGIEIIDYKTGSNPLSQKEADNNLQLSIYALAASSINDKPFGVGPENIKLSLYYFDRPQIVTTTRTVEDLKEAKKQILDYKKQIEASDFKCSKHILCKNCEYKMLCSFTS